MAKRRDRASEQLHLKEPPPRAESVCFGALREGLRDRGYTAGRFRLRPGMLDRRAFLAVAVGGLVTPLVAAAQPAGKVPRIGVLVFTTVRSYEPQFRQALREQGYVEGQNIVVEWRAADGRADRARLLADELVRLKVDVIVALTTAAVQAAKEATRTIPIVMVSGEPVRTGLVTSLARPGGNVTGVSLLAAELSEKRIELLREILPGVTRLATLVNRASPFATPFVEESQAAARKAGVHLRVLDVRQPADVEVAFGTMVKERMGAVIVGSGVAAPEWRTQALALRHRIPAVYFQRQFAEAGGLASFGAHLADANRRAITFVDRILKGAKPADLPVEQPTKFELVINLKTARALGLTIPPSLLARADQVIE